MMSVKQILDTIDLGQFQALRLKHQGDYAAKFLDLEYWLDVNLKRAVDLGLRGSLPSRVLDIGCGAGYFLYVCRLLGHEVIGIDQPGQQMFSDIRGLLDVRCVPHTVRAMQPLPDLGTFDVATAHMVCFNGHSSWTTLLANPPPAPLDLWGPKEWAWLLDDVDAYLTFLELNAEMDGTLFPPGLREFFESRGAKIDGPYVRIVRS